MTGKDKQESAYEVVRRGYRTAERTGKPHIVPMPRSGDAERFFVTDPRSRMSSIVLIPGCVIAACGGSALMLLKDRKGYP